MPYVDLIIPCLNVSLKSFRNFKSGKSALLTCSKALMWKIHKLRTFCLILTGFYLQVFTRFEFNNKRLGAMVISKLGLSRLVSRIASIKVEYLIDEITCPSGLFVCPALQQSDVGIEIMSPVAI